MIEQMIQILNQERSNSLEKEIFLPLSSDTFSILKVLEKEGYLTILSIQKNPKPLIGVRLKNNPSNHWSGIKLISKPSRRVYVKHNHLTQFSKYGLGTSIIRTSRGFFTELECIWNKIGGEWILKVF